MNWGVGQRLGFYVNLPLGAVVAGCLLFQDVPEPKRKPPARQVLATAIKSLDLVGFALICPAAIMFFLGLQFGGNRHPWNSSTVIGLLVGAAATLVVFLFWEYRQGDEAMVPFALLRHRVIWSAAMTLFFVLSSILVADYYLAIYFQVVLDDSPLMSGVHMLPVTLGLVFFTMISGSMSKWRPAYIWQHPAPSFPNRCGFTADGCHVTQLKLLATTFRGSFWAARSPLLATDSCRF